MEKKRVIFALVLFSIIFISSCAPDLAPRVNPCVSLVDITTGDSDLNGRVDLNDVVVMIDYVLENTKITEPDLSLCNSDINEDGSVNRLDLRESQRIYTQRYNIERQIECEDSVMGDGNEDGVVNILDVVLAIGIILGSDQATDLQECIFDLNEDAIINILDIVLLVDIILDEPPEEEISGCTDDSACNYDPEAVEDDGSCEYAEEHYDCEGNCLNDENEDGICDELEEIVSGCTDSLADNYNPEAVEDDESCEYLGCTDPIADNYDPINNVDDGSCEYTGSGIVDEDGGIVSGETEDVSVDIPGGALEEDVEITVEDVNEEEVVDAQLPEGEYSSASNYYSFEPHGQEFSEPVTISLPYTGESNGLIFIKLDNEEDTTWEAIEGGSFVDGIASVSVNSFSIFSVLVDESVEEPEPTCGDGTCDADETYDSCSADCPPTCGGQCEVGIGSEGCLEDLSCVCYCDALCYDADNQDCCIDIDLNSDGSFTGEEYNEYCGIDEDQNDDHDGDDNGDGNGNGNGGSNGNGNGGGTYGSTTAPSEESEEEGPLFDIKVNLAEGSEALAPGDELTSEILLFNFGDLSPVDVVLNCELNNFNISDNRTYDMFEETLAVEVQTSILRNMNVPDDAPLGNYLMECSINYNEEIEVHSSDVVNVISRLKKELPSVQLLTILGLFILLIIAIAIIVVLVFRGLNKRIARKRTSKNNRKGKKK